MTVVEPVLLFVRKLLLAAYEYAYLLYSGDIGYRHLIRFA